MIFPAPRTLCRGDGMEPKKFPPRPAADLRLRPDLRLCPRFDACSIALFPVARPGEMGFRVLDNCVEEHIQ